MREALQAGPFLVERNRPVTGLNADKSAARTVVFQDARGRSGFLIAKSTTLAETAEILSTPAIFPEGKIVRALNLDGGSSTALWVRGAPPFYAHEVEVGCATISPSSRAEDGEGGFPPSHHSE